MADKDHEAALAELLGEVGPLDDKKAGATLAIDPRMEFTPARTTCPWSAS